MKVLFVTPEVTPYSKTGGLADVSAGLPAALADLGVQVKVVSPMYRSVAEGGFPMRTLRSQLEVPFRGKSHRERVFLQRIKPELSYYFVKRDEYYDRSGLYGSAGGEYFDNADRFIFFCRAVLSLSRLLRFKPDIIHCHDWQTALIPAMLKTASDDSSYWSTTRTVYTIHNLAYQGVFPQEYMAVSDLPSELFSLDGLEFYGQMNFMKAGIVFGDRITTVSPTYAKEILTPEFGYGLDGVLREHKGRLQGILNGVDYQDWDPVRDPHIARRFSSGDLSGKAECKRDLREIFALSGPPGKPLLGIVARLVEQKGLDLVVKAAGRILKAGADLVVLGSGDEIYQKELSALARRNRGRMGVRIGFDPGLAHRIEAGADMFLMPSRYEPCGLNQMYSLKYGTIPIVRATGGLEDSIQEFDPETLRGNGFKFKPYTAAALVSSIRTALAVYKQKSLWSILMKNAMWMDFSWEKAAAQYLKLYGKTTKLKR